MQVGIPGGEHDACSVRRPGPYIVSGARKYLCNTSSKIMNEQALVVIDGDASSVRRDTRLPKARGLEGQGFAPTLAIEPRKPP